MKKSFSYKLKLGNFLLYDSFKGLKKWHKKLICDFIYDVTFNYKMGFYAILHMYSNLLKEYYYENMLNLREFTYISQIMDNYLKEICCFNSVVPSHFDISVVIKDEVELFKQYQKYKENNQN